MKAEKSAAKRKKTAIQKVTSLVKKLGYASLHHLLENVDHAIAAVPVRIRKRAKIDDATRKSVIALLKTGATVAVVAKKHKISAPSVNLIKKKAGLTKSRKPVKKAAPAKKKAVKKVKVPHKVEAPVEVPAAV